MPPPVHVVCAVIQRGELVLLAQRPPGKSLAGFWEFPGGKVEKNERAADALLREIREELGCEIAALRPGPAHIHVYGWGDIRLQPFICRIAENSAEPLPHEHTALQWVALRDLPKFELAPADLPVVEWLLAGGAGD